MGMCEAWELKGASKTGFEAAARLSEDACIGAFFGDSGNCTAVKIRGESGELVEVKRYCYSGSPTNVRTKAKWEHEGACYIPRSYPCDSTYQCRPGTFCL